MLQPHAPLTGVVLSPLQTSAILGLFQTHIAERTDNQGTAASTATSYLSIRTTFSWLLRRSVKETAVQWSRNPLTEPCSSASENLGALFETPRACADMCNK